ncbi:MAG: hypothetical protein P8K76_14115, partial [Candidatus Binatia bacterium]|nr:hypothetical protein [Candidatus Binatia bacterium]
MSLCRLKAFLGLLAVALVLTTFAARDAHAVECVGDRTYETAVADGCTSITGDLRIEDTLLPHIDGLSALT